MLAKFIILGSELVIFLCLCVVEEIKRNPKIIKKIKYINKKLRWKLVKFSARSKTFFRKLKFRLHILLKKLYRISFFKRFKKK